ncbi:hypothetical protein AB0A70_00800 [Streptomyces morookaense]|uniref:hypothetical protein n=1 Tax=Streptomyces morookaense TaxID=1970 RepID=UPI0033E7E485
MSGPLAYPTRDECGVCDRFRSAINGAVGRVQWARVQGHETERRTFERQEAEYREGWRIHLARTPHKEA